MPKPVIILKNRIKKAVQDFETDTGVTIKNVRLIRLDQPVLHEGEVTDLMNLEIPIK